MQELLELIQPTLVTLVSLLLGYAGLKVKNYYDLKVSSEKQDQIIKVIQATVLFVEQVSGENLLSEDKLALAKHRALETLEGMGITLSDEELTMWIESFVNGLNQNKKVEEK